jgi:prepilin-type N-terminal cleavage/methylation domain-containing protein
MIARARKRSRTFWLAATSFGMNPGSRRAFTVIELTLAMAAAGILSTFAVLRAGSFLDRIAVRGAAVEIQSLFSLARHVAISHGAQSVLDIDAATGTLSVRVGAEPVTTAEIGRAHGVTISSGRSAITYSPIGVGYGAANFTMIVSRGNEADSIVVSRLGRVRRQ